MYFMERDEKEHPFGHIKYPQSSVFTQQIPSFGFRLVVSVAESDEEEETDIRSVAAYQTDCRASDPRCLTIQQHQPPSPSLCKFSTLLSIPLLQIRCTYLLF